MIFLVSLRSISSSSSLMRPMVSALMCIPSHNQLTLIRSMRDATQERS